MESSNAKGWNIWELIGILSLLGLFWVLFGYVVCWKFEIVNSFFSAMAFGAIIYSIYQQGIELKQTRDEFKAQNETFSKQRFENTFFKMLELVQHNLLFVNLDVAVGQGSIQEKMREHFGVEKESYRGQNGIESLIKHFCSVTTHLKNHDYSTSSLAQILEKEVERYDAINYLISLINIFRLVSNSILIRDDERIFYASIINSNLTNADKHLLFLSTMSQEHKALRPILTKFGAKPDLNINQFRLDEKVLYSLANDN